MGSVKDLIVDDSPAGKLYEPAKIISLQRPELREKIKDIARKKRASYKERNILEEVRS